MEIELAPGLTRWTGWHAEWKAQVGSVCWQTPDVVCLIDPIVPREDSADLWRFLDMKAGRRDSRTAARRVHVLVTLFWHTRQAGAIVERYGSAQLWAHAPASKPIERRAGVAVSSFGPGDELPGGIRAFPVRGSEVAFWIDKPRALVVGDVILGDEDEGLRLCPPSWTPTGGGPERVRQNLNALSGLPIESVLVSHGEPVLEGAAGAFARLLKG